MKLISLVLVMLMASVEVWAAPDQDAGHSNPAPAPTLVGEWDLVRHACSSGAPPADNFNPNRDRFQINFRQGSFSAYNQSGNCQVWSSGRYDFDGNVLVLNTNQGNSNCNTPIAVGPIAYPLDFLSADVFVIHMGPVNGGVCPRGDLLQNTYRRFN